MDNPKIDPKDSHGWLDLLRSVREHVGNALPMTFVMIAISSVLEGAGLVLILPMAEVIFSANTATGSATGQNTTLFLQAMISVGADTVLKQLVLLSVCFMMLMIVRALVLMRRDILLMQLSQGYVDGVRRQFFDTLARADWPVIKRFQRAHLLDNMTTNIGRISSAMRFMTQGTITMGLTLAYLVSAFVVNAAIGFLLLLMLLLVMLLALIWLRRSHGLGDKMTKGNRGVMKETTRFLEGLKAAKACQAEEEFAQRFRARIDTTRKISVEFVVQQSRVRRAIELIGAMAAISLLLIGYALIGLSGAELLIMGAIVIRLVPGLVSTFNGLQSVAFALPAFTAATETRLLIEGKTATLAKTNVNQTPINMTHETDHPSFGGIEISDASVVVGNGEDETVLVHAGKITLPANGMVHISGPSGAGKSSLAELVAGLYMPASGDVIMKLDGERIAMDGVTRSLWQQQLSYAPQEPFLFDGDVRENLCWPNVHATDQEIWRALQHSMAEELVRGLPGQLDEMLLDGGNRLSGGERQRLCLARALLRPSSILILDEATSAVDVELQDEIFHNLSEIAKTRLVLVVAHTGKAIQWADQHIQVKGGVAG